MVRVTIIDVIRRTARIIQNIMWKYNVRAPSNAEEQKFYQLNFW